MRSQKAKNKRNWLFAALRVAAGWAGVLMADRPASKKPPPGNWIANRVAQAFHGQPLILIESVPSNQSSGEFGGQPSSVRSTRSPPVQSGPDPYSGQNSSCFTETLSANERTSQLPLWVHQKSQPLPCLICTCYRPARSGISGRADKQYRPQAAASTAQIASLHSIVRLR